MVQADRDLLVQLLSLIDKLRSESADFVREHADQQQWYNRGYANGMVNAMRAAGLEDALEGRAPDAAGLLQGHEVMSWGKAYRHGEEMGARELRDIIEQASAASRTPHR